MSLRLSKILPIGCGQTYLVKTHDGHYLEMGDVFMARELSLGSRPYAYADFVDPSDTNKRVMTICTMAGCSMHCRFCSMHDSFKRNLSAEEIVEQVGFMAEQGIALGRNPDLNAAKEFRVLYTRMGEPMVNINAVIDSIQRLIELYPHVIIGMSTSGVISGLEKLLECPDILPHIDMQISLHSTDADERRELFGRNAMPLELIAEYAKRWHHITGKQLSLNVILFEGYSYDFKSMVENFEFDPKSIWFRLSPWNVVAGADFDSLLKVQDIIAKQPLSGDVIAMIIHDIKDLGIAFAYAPAIDKEIENQVACGQALEAFKNMI
ncbi:MAG: hypothetical protein WC473_03110 [Patescibacteria group bacterium]